jgi:hypothetical protein
LDAQQEGWATLQNRQGLALHCMPWTARLAESRHVMEEVQRRALDATRPGTHHSGDPVSAAF